MSSRGSFYLTKKGLRELKKEYEKLKELRALKTKKGAPEVLISEELNAEFVDFQEDLNLLDGRLEELEYIFKNYEIIQVPPKEQQSMVQVGATVTLEVGNEIDEFTIVGTPEAEPVSGRISNECPVGRALLGHRVGDVIEVSSPQKTLYKIKKISYSTI